MNTIKTTETTDKIKALHAAANLLNYDSLQVGTWVETPLGDFYVNAKPNIYQSVNARFWEFEHCTDECGEPFTAGEVIRIKA